MLTHALRAIALMAITQVIANVSLGDEPQDRTAAELLPPTIVAYAEVDSPSSLVELVLSHPLRVQLEKMPVYEQAMQGEDLVKLRSGISVFEAGMGMRWPKVVSALSSGGLFVAFDASTEGAVLFLKGKQPEVQQQLKSTVFSMLRAGKVKGSDEDPVSENYYREVQYQSMGEELHVTSLGAWIVVTNKAKLGKAVIDRYLDAEQDRLTDVEGFKQAIESRETGQSAWAFVNIKMIRDSGTAEEIYSGRTDNFIAELLFGGIMTNLQNTPYATISLNAKSEKLSLSLATPHDPDWVGEDRAYYFGSDGLAKAPAPPTLSDQLFAFTSYRDMSQLWLRAGDLMTQKGNDELAQADTALTTFFSGQDFGEDILGALKPEIQFVAVRQNFEQLLPRPAIKLPAFAFLFQMKDPEQTQPEFRRVFQSFIGFFNVLGAMNGQPQFDLDIQRDEQSQLISATYVPERDEREATDAAINFNFSPTLAFSGQNMILASTVPLARTLLDLPGAVSKSADSNTLAQLDASVLHQTLDDNRDQLVAQNMLEKGHDQAAAEAETGLILELLGFLQGAKLSLDADQDRMALNLSIQLATP